LYLSADEETLKQHILARGTDKAPLSQSTGSKLFSSPTSGGGDPASSTNGETASGTLWVRPQSRDGCAVNTENYRARMNFNLDVE
jgi:hypothetical protein